MVKIFKKKWFKRVALGFASILIIVIAAVPFVQASEPRNFDSNAVVYGGYYSVNELINKLDNGTGKIYQSADQLQNLYSAYGVNQSQFGDLKDGTVYKDGRVTVGDRVVFTNAHSIGREWMPGSTQQDQFTYPIYLRSTTVSFASPSIPAFVYLNQDGTMAYALIKSCGNVVPGQGVKVPTHQIIVKKFNDLNGDGIRQSNEPFLPGWTFSVKGPDTNVLGTTESDGAKIFNRLENGNYTITERQQSGWESTTGLTRVVKLSGTDLTVLFGNEKIIVTPTSYEIMVKKYEDINGDGLHESNEPWLSGWKMTLTGNNINKNVTTDNNGVALFTNLPAGNYVVTETMQKGWTNITSLKQDVSIGATDPEGYLEFGNMKIVHPAHKFTIIARKFEDINGNGIKDSSEPWLSGWDIKITGNGENQDYLTDGDGEVTFRDLPSGTYVLTETLQPGWQNITPLSQNVTVNDSHDSGYVEFGNQQIPASVVSTTPSANLPVTGPEEAFAGTFAAMGIGGAGFMYRKSRLKLKAAFKKF